jgi:hypothetical protein
MSRDEQAIEKEIQDKGLNAPRLNPAHIDAQIASEYWGRASDLFTGSPTHKSMGCLTLYIIVLKNGFVVTGESACASPENYDAEIGRKIARDNARNKIWALEGYLLRSKLAAAA